MEGGQRERRVSPEAGVEGETTTAGYDTMDQQQRGLVCVQRPASVQQLAQQTGPHTTPQMAGQRMPGGQLAPTTYLRQ